MANAHFPEKRKKCKAEKDNSLYLRYFDRIQVQSCNTPCFFDTLYLPQFIALEFRQATLTVQKRYPSLSCQTRCRHGREGLLHYRHFRSQI